MDFTNEPSARYEDVNTSPNDFFRDYQGVVLPFRSTAYPYFEYIERRRVFKTGGQTDPMAPRAPESNPATSTASL